MSDNLRAFSAKSTCIMVSVQRDGATSWVVTVEFTDGKAAISSPMTLPMDVTETEALRLAVLSVQRAYEARGAIASVASIEEN